MALIGPNPPLNVVLVEPRIPPNTGNVARTCAVTGCRLHLVGPLGFSLADKDLRRAGLDYWGQLWRRHHENLETFVAEAPPTGAWHLFTARSTRSLWESRFAPGDFLFFGSEPEGLPAKFLAAHPGRTVGIPMRDGSRSLNLSTSVGIAVYEALRQVAAAIG